MGRTCSQVCVCTCVFVYFLCRLFRLFTADKSALLFIKKKKMSLPQCVCYPRIKQACGRQQPEGLHWSPLWKWRCESLTEIVCSQLLAHHATGADSPTVCLLLTLLRLSVCVPPFAFVCLCKRSITSTSIEWNAHMHVDAVVLSTNHTPAGGRTWAWLCSGGSILDIFVCVFRCNLCNI